MCTSLKVRAIDTESRKTESHPTGIVFFFFLYTCKLRYGGVDWTELYFPKYKKYNLHVMSLFIFLLIWCAHICIASSSSSAVYSNRQAALRLDVIFIQLTSRDIVRGFTQRNRFSMSAGERNVSITYLSFLVGFSKSNLLELSKMSCHERTPKCSYNMQNDYDAI